jgi:hypothetical protein
MSTTESEVVFVCNSCNRRLSVSGSTIPTEPNNVSVRCDCGVNYVASKDKNSGNVTFKVNFTHDSFVNLLSGLAFVFIAGAVVYESVKNDPTYLYKQVIPGFGILFAIYFAYKKTVSK